MAEMAVHRWIRHVRLEIQRIFACAPALYDERTPPTRYRRTLRQTRLGSRSQGSAAISRHDTPATDTIPKKSGLPTPWLSLKSVRRPFARLLRLRTSKKHRAARPKSSAAWHA